MAKSGGTAGDNKVALLAEGVDRNHLHRSVYSWLYVALLAEGVDRNYFGQTNDKEYVKSPSSRRAWIEIGFYRA